MNYKNSIIIVKTIPAISEDLIIITYYGHVVRSVCPCIWFTPLINSVQLLYDYSDIEINQQISSRWKMMFIKIRLSLLIKALKLKKHKTEFIFGVTF